MDRVTLLREVAYILDDIRAEIGASRADILEALNADAVREAIIKAATKAREIEGRR